MQEILSDDRIVRHIEWVSVAVLFAVTGGGWYFFSLHAAGGVLLGGVISIVSFRILKWQLRRAFANPEKIPGKGRVLASYYIRFLAVAFIIYMVIYYEWVHPISLLIGLSVVVVSLFMVGIREYLALLQKGEN